MNHHIRKLTNILSIPKSLVLILALAVTVLVPFINVGQALADGQCYQALVAPGGTGDCSPTLKVTSGGFAKPGICYNTIWNTPHTAFVYRPAACSAPRFRSPQSVTCKDGNVHKGDPKVAPWNDTPAKICAAFGGYTAPPPTTPTDPDDEATRGPVVRPSVLDPAQKCAEGSSGPACSKNIMEKYINPAIRFLSAGVGVIVVAMIIVGGIKYSMAENDPQKIAAARSQIFNALIALVAYILMYGFLLWVVPGAQAP